jgi:hypothetical protein
VTDRRERDLKRRLLVLAEPLGARVDIDRTAKAHLKATISRGARRVVLFFAATPSDFRGERNGLADVKRKLRSLGAA